MAHAEHEHGTYWHLDEMRAEAQQLTDHDRDATSAPRLHHVNPTTDTTRTARATPATTLSTRCTPFTSVLARVACTTSKAVSAAIRGGGSRKPTDSATTKAATVAPVIRAARDNADRPRVRTRLPARAVVVRATLRSPHQIPSTRTRNGPLPTVTTISPCTSGTSGSRLMTRLSNQTHGTAAAQTAFMLRPGMHGMVIRRVAPLRVWVDYVGGGGLGEVGAVAAGELSRRNRERPPHAARPAVGTDHVPVRAGGGVPHRPALNSAGARGGRMCRVLRASGRSPGPP